MKKQTTRLAMPDGILQADLMEEGDGDTTVIHIRITDERGKFAGFLTFTKEQAKLLAVALGSFVDTDTLS